MREHETESAKLLAAGKANEAAQELELQIQVNPSYPWAFPELCELYWKLERKEDAVRVLHKFLGGAWTRQAKCEVMRRFGDLGRYRVPGDIVIDQYQSDCVGK